MKVLSFDIGIKNLAYAYVTKKEDDETFKVGKTGLFNLDEKPKCYMCKKPSFYFNFQNIEMIYCCKGHADSMKTQKIKKKTIEEYLTTLIKNLDTLDIENIDMVVIENQPSFQNPTCKSISVMVMTYFKMKGLNVKFQNPTSKIFNHKFEKKRDKYKQTKLYAIKLCKELIDKKDMQEIILLQKCDDICDAILHGVYWLCNGKVPDKIKHLI